MATRKAALHPTWQPLSVRRTGSAAPEIPLVDGVPDYLLEPIVHWLASYDKTALYARVALIFRVKYERPYRDAMNSVHLSGPHPSVGRAREFLRVIAAAQGGGAGILDALDMILHETDDESGPDRELLDQLLSDSGSLFRVAADGKGLEERTTETARHAFTRSVSHGGAAADHLRDAWRHAYGRNPNASKAYSDAIKAIESATIPVVSPSNKKATLGTVIGEISSDISRFNFAITNTTQPAVETIVQLMRMVWEGQRDRHGSATPRVAPSLGAARTAVSAAVALVEWFATGAITRSP